MECRFAAHGSGGDCLGGWFERLVQEVVSENLLVNEKKRRRKDRSPWLFSCVIFVEISGTKVSRRVAVFITRSMKTRYLDGGEDTRGFGGCFLAVSLCEYSCITFL